MIVVADLAAQRYPGALAVCERALAEPPELPKLHSMRAAAPAHAGRLEAARQSLAEVRRPQPHFPRAEFGDRFSDAAVRDRYGRHCAGRWVSVGPRATLGADPLASRVFEEAASD